MSGPGRDFGLEYRREMGAYIRHLRLERGMTQIELGEALGMGMTAVSAIETGRNSLPPELVEACAEALKVPVKEFAKVFLRWTNPWMYKIFVDDHDPRLLQDLASMPTRVGLSATRGRNLTRK